MKVVEVDKERLFKALKKKSYSPKTLSVDMGHSPNYIHVCLNQYGGLPEGAVRFLQKFYGIMYEEYKPAEMQNPDGASDSTGQVDTAAIVDALKAALSSYAWKEEIARTVRFVMREEATEDMLKHIIAEAIEEKLK